MTETHLCGLWKRNEFSKLESWQQVSCLTFKTHTSYSWALGYPLTVLRSLSSLFAEYLLSTLLAWDPEWHWGHRHINTKNCGKCHDGGGEWMMWEPRKEASRRVCGVGTPEKGKAQEVFCHREVRRLEDEYKGNQVKREFQTARTASSEGKGGEGKWLIQGITSSSVRPENMTLIGELQEISWGEKQGLEWLRF